MGCNLTLHNKIKKFLRKAPKDVVDRINEKLQQLAENPFCGEKLKPPLQELYKTRVGKYRIGYYIKPCNVIVISLDVRERFYDELIRSL